MTRMFLNVIHCLQRYYSCFIFFNEDISYDVPGKQKYIENAVKLFALFCLKCWYWFQYLLDIFTILLYCFYLFTS